MKDDEPFTLLVDGYNVLHNMRDIFEPYWENGIPRDKARRYLCDLIVKGLGKARACEARIHFDGPYPSQEAVSDNVKLIYSGGEGGHRADQVILGELSGIEKARMGDYCVVTDDWKGFGEEVLTMGALLMPLQQFAAMLKSWDTWS